ncbi:MAG TPA: ABC transporter ATP-binding protein [Plasticicumulans sp.]|uniref:ABC transporter ATP-binding protein n=4 Tax=Plasticicumulans sp. TaxID=2307179 RepID=UPI002C7CBE80|nr:ABC transporter ATP-binding protein [Plasticicumulans sp.]HNE00464.1 ABC transporter ATP-binding protein [Plasticicumulans sp.]HNF64765.1 ABC transporter ATP-binding protein [Plasticicumulans sp.]HNI22351.1 ABC transporter ATP-binding protein [Plasticicumulans sp.]
MAADAGTATAPAPAPLLEARGLSVEVGTHRVCTGLGFALRAGERWGLLGANGSGKTTLLHTLAGLRAPQAGEVRLDGLPLTALAPRRRALRLGLLPQEHEDAFPATVAETALTGRFPHLGRFGHAGAADRAAVEAALAATGLAAHAQRQVATLSGGERRRLGFATLLAQDPAVLLLDEPTNHLDLGYQVRLLDALAARVAAEGRGWIMVSHDATLVARFCTHVLLVYGDGRTATGGPQLLCPQQLSALYGHPVLRLDGPLGPVFAPG